MANRSWSSSSSGGHVTSTETVTLGIGPYAVLAVLVVTAGLLVACAARRRRLRAKVTYEDVVRYAISHAPHIISVDRAVVVREACVDGVFTLHQLFLDASGEPLRRSDGRPYGRTLVARRLDDELIDAFGNSNVLVLT